MSGLTFAVDSSRRASIAAMASIILFAAASSSAQHERERPWIASASVAPDSLVCPETSTNSWMSRGGPAWIPSRLVRHSLSSLDQVVDLGFLVGMTHLASSIAVNCRIHDLAFSYRTSPGKTHEPPEWVVQHRGTRRARASGERAAPA